MASGESIRVPPPTAVTVFGILNLIFGGLGMCGMAASAAFIFLPLAADMPKGPNPFMAQEGPVAAWLRISMLLGCVATGVLIASGIGLLRMRPWGQKLAIGYSVYGIISSILGMAVQVWLMSRLQRADGNPDATALIAGTMGGVIGGCIGIVYPALLWYFMTRPNVVAAFAGAEPPNPYGTDFVPPLSGAGLDLSNPYASPRTVSAAPTAHITPSAESVVDTFIPAKNGPALASYYLGLFSLLPCFGFPMGVAAIYLGVKGLRNVHAHPEIRGGAHAWVGVICGSLFGLMNFVFIVLFVIGMVVAATK